MKHKNRYLPVLPFLLLFLVNVFATQAQDTNPFKESTFRKVPYSSVQDSSQYYNNINWTGQGLQSKITIDDIPTIELRARLQALFGDPTKKVEQIVQEGRFGTTEGATIEFEYIFMVNGHIPLTVMDTNGPFTTGLTMGGASQYVDLMPQIKRTFSRKLMNVQNLKPFSDYFYSPEKDQWFLVSYKNGEFSKKKISPPEGMHYRH